MKTLWNQIKFQKDLYLFSGLVMLGMYIFGTILHDVLFASDGEATSVVCIGSFMAMMGFVMAMFFCAGTHMVQICNYALAMGQTRKRTYAAYTLAVFLTFFVLAVCMKALNALEIWRLGLMFPGRKIENLVAGALEWKVLLAFALVGTACAMLLGASLGRFGKKAYVVFWLIWMAVCIGGPRVSVYLTVNHSDSRLTAFVLQLFVQAAKHAQVLSVVLVVAVTIIFNGIAYLLVRRQQVTI